MCTSVRKLRAYLCRTLISFFASFLVPCFSLSLARTRSYSWESGSTVSGLPWKPNPKIVSLVHYWFWMRLIAFSLYRHCRICKPPGRARSVHLLWHQDPCPPTSPSFPAFADQIFICLNSNENDDSEFPYVQLFLPLAQSDPLGLRT